jgi:hypothetical protein
VSTLIECAAAAIGLGALLLLTTRRRRKSGRHTATR